MNIIAKARCSCNCQRQNHYYSSSMSDKRRNDNTDSKSEEESVGTLTKGIYLSSSSPESGDGEGGISRAASRNPVSHATSRESRDPMFPKPISARSKTIPWTTGESGSSDKLNWGATDAGQKVETFAFLLGE